MCRKGIKKMKNIRFIITALLVMTFASCANDTQVVQIPTPENELISEAVASEPDSTPTLEPVIDVPDNTPTPELVIDVPDNTPTPEPVIDVPDNTPTPEPVIDVPDNTLTPEPVIDVPDNTPTPEPVIAIPDNTPTPEPVIVIACNTPTPQPVFSELDNQQNPSIILEPAAHGNMWTIIPTIEEFHNRVIAANGAYDTGNVNASSISNEDIQRLTGNVFYYDFVNPVYDIALDEIRVHQNYVVLDYRRYRNNPNYDFPNMIIQTVRSENADVESFLAGYRRSMANPEAIIINGNPALKEVTEGFNCYYWVQNGSVIMVYVPGWILGRYPEETFFNIHRIDIQ